MLCVWKAFLSAWQEYLPVSIVTSKEEINEIKFSRFTGEYKSAKHWCLYMTATLARSVGVTVTLCDLTNIQIYSFVKKQRIWTMNIFLVKT